MANHDRTRWPAHRSTARAIRLLSYVIPFGAAVGAAFLVASWLPAPPAFSSELLRLGAIVVVSAVVMVAVDRVTRWLVPWSYLLATSMTFPGEAPSRRRLARQTGTVSELRLGLVEAGRGGVGQDPNVTAANLLGLIAMLAVHGRLTRGHAARVERSMQAVAGRFGAADAVADDGQWAPATWEVAALNADLTSLDQPGRPSGTVLGFGLLAALLGIAASPTSAVAFETMTFGAPIPFVGGEPFTDDQQGSDAPPPTVSDGTSASTGLGPQVPAVDIAGRTRAVAVPAASGADATVGSRPPLGSAEGGAPDPVVPVVPPPTTSSTVPATTNPPATTRPSTTVPPPPASTTVPPTTTTTTTSTTTTTTVPPTTTTTTSTSTTSTSTSTTSTSTTVPPSTPDAFLVAPSTSGSTSQPVLALGVGAPPAVELANYDTDRDDLPGLTIQASYEHLYSEDPDQLQRFRLRMTQDTLLDGELHVALWVAASEFAEQEVGVIVAVYECEGESCTKLGWAKKWFHGADGFQQLTLGLGWVERIVEAGHDLELRVAALGESDGDLMLAFGTQQFPSRLVLEQASCRSVERTSGC